MAIQAESFASYGGRGMALLRRLAERTAGTFTVADARTAARSVGIAEPYLPVLLHRLVRAGLITRVKRGTYALGVPIGRSLDVHPFAIGMALVEPSVVSGWSALHHHGLTDQIPQRVTLSTPKRVVTPTMRGASATAPSVWEAAGHTFEIVNVLPDNFYGYDEHWMGDVHVRIFDRERALLDCFASPRRFGSLSEGLGILDEHLPEIDLQRFVAHAQRFSKRVVAKRIGYVLEMFGVAAHIVEPLRTLPMLGYRALDPTRQEIGERDRRWQVIANLRAPDLSA